MSKQFQSFTKAVNGWIQTFLADIKYHPFSGKTLILLSVMAWLLALLMSTEVLRDFLATLGWAVLIPGLGWELMNWKIQLLEITLFPGPWVTGAVTSAFLYEAWNIDGSVAISIWPLVSALISLFPRFFKYGLSVVDPRYPDPKKLAAERQSLLNTLLLSSILSCWFQFHFLTQSWLEDYPILLVDDVRRSAFIIRVGQGDRPPTSRGVLFLEVIEPLLERELESLSWGQVEQWLLRIQPQMSRLVLQAKEQIPAVPEDEGWRFQVETQSANPGYRLILRAILSGPASQAGGYMAEKTCLITEALNDRPSDTSPPATTRVECGPAQDRIMANSGNASPQRSV